MRAAAILCLVTSIGAVAAVLVDRTLAVPKHRIFASCDGSHGVDLVVKYKDARVKDVIAVLFRFDRDGELVKLWEKHLPYVPHRMLVSDSGVVVSVDEYARRGFKHALVLFDGAGGICADHALEDVLPSADIKQYVPRTVSSRHWTTDYTWKFTQKELVILTSWGRSIRLNLASGRVVLE